MMFLNFILFAVIAALVASMYYYYKEKRLLKEFMRHSRRHRFHQEIDLVRRQKANRYLSISVILFCIALPLLMENFIDGFIVDNWKWLLPTVVLSLLAGAYKGIGANRSSQVADSLAMSMERDERSPQQ